MTTRLRLVIGCALILAALAGTTASASAFSWWIETGGGGEEVLKAGIKEAFDPTMKGSATLVLSWSTNEVKCTKGSYEEGFIEGTVGLGAKAFVYEACSVSKPTGCSIEGAKIKTAALVGSISQVGSGVEFQTKPVSGTTLAEFKLTGESCLIKGSQTAKGTIGGSLTKPKELTTEKSFEIENVHSSVSVGATKGSVSGGDGYSATKGWSAH